MVYKASTCNYLSGPWFCSTIAKMSVVMLSVGLAACGSLTGMIGSSEFQEDVERHIFYFDRLGWMCKNEKKIKDALCDQYADRDELAGRIALLLSSTSESEQDRIMFHVHGGLNGLDTGKKNARRRVRALLKQPDRRHIPVLVVWPSGGLSSYGEHLLSVREGRNTNPLIGYSTAPLVLTADILKSLGRTLPSLWYNTTNQKDEWMARLSTPPESSELKPLGPPAKWISRAWREAQHNYCIAARRALAPKPGIACYPGFIHRIGSDWGPNARWSRYEPGSERPVRRLAQKLGLFPFRMGTNMLFHSEAGRQSWHMMKRRAISLSAPVGDFDSRVCTGDSCKIGAGAIDAGELFATLVSSRNGRLVDLIGHSMGAIVINQILTRENSAAVSGGVGDIVFLAGADSISSSLAVTSNIIRQMLAGNEKKTPPRVYSHGLSRIAELREMQWGGFTTSGSLLIHVDQMFEQPAHPLGRTIGSEINVFSAADALARSLAGIADRYLFVAWDRKRNCLPRTHGEMGDAVFLNPRNWRFMPDRDLCPVSLESDIG